MKDKNFHRVFISTLGVPGAAAGWNATSHRLQQAGINCTDRWESDRAGKSVSRFVADSDVIYAPLASAVFEKFETRYQHGSVVAWVGLSSAVGNGSGEGDSLPSVAGEKKTSLPP